MNNSNPFVPQGSLLEQKNKKRARVKVAVFSIFAINVLVILPLLIQGCKKTEQTTETPPPPLDTNTNLPDTNIAQLPPPPTNLVTQVQSNLPSVQPPQPPVMEQPTAHEYVVAKNDSFYTIAKKFGVKIKDIEAANPGVVPTKLKVGQKLQIPAASSSSSSSGSAGTSTPVPDGGENVYVVKSGDSLTKIAKEHGTTVKAIRTANDLKTDKIKVGQKLKIPAKPAPVETTPSAPAPAPVIPATTPAAAPATGAGPGH